MPESSTNSSKHPIELPKGQMTRARARQFQEAVSALITQFWEENKLDVNGEAWARGEFGKDVVIGGGFSGHGFKMSPTIGRILTDLALIGEG
ncbi:putative sarcosine oxidase [Gossypium australe]|uniref:Putative sarcosine oxidase n=1 Tax=Gossypium australe TaxID=47621 RepID=A0A5B6W7W6_9ROSI|nr:putative sarcosine oxidase [Gossypium australe]